MRPLLIRCGLVIVTLLGAACSGTRGLAIELDVVPSPAALTADTLTIALTRLDTQTTRRYSFALPTPKPTAPWILDLTTHGWERAALRVEVTALRDAVEVAHGESDVIGELVTIVLEDSPLGGRDLASADAAGADLASVDAAMGDLEGTDELFDLRVADLQTSSADLVPVIDLFSPDLGCPTTTLEVDASEDAYIVVGNPTTNFGTRGSVVIRRTSSTTSGLFKFAVPVIPTASIRAVRLQLTYAMYADECGTGCGPCNIQEAAGLLSFYSMRSDWGEAEVTWDARGGTSSWGTAGASGSTDRNATAFTTTNHATEASVDVVMPSASYGELATWRDPLTGTYSIQVVPGATPSPAFIVKSHDTGGCTTNAKPHLTITYCTP